MIGETTVSILNREGAIVCPVGGFSSNWNVPTTPKEPMYLIPGLSAGEYRLSW